MHHSWYLLACCPLEDIAPPNINENLDSSVSFPLLTPLAQPTEASWCRLLRFICSTFVERALSSRRRHPFTFLLSHRPCEYRVSFANGLNGSSCKEKSGNVHTSNPFPCAPFIESAVVCLSTPPSSVYSIPLLCLDPWALEAGAPARVIFWWLFAKNYRVKLGKCFPVPPFPLQLVAQFPEGFVLDLVHMMAERIQMGRWNEGGKEAATAAVAVCIRKHYQETWFECKVPPPIQTCLARMVHWAGVLESEYHQWRWQWNGKALVDMVDFSTRVWSVAENHRLLDCFGGRPRDLNSRKSLDDPRHPNNTLTK